MLVDTEFVGAYHRHQTPALFEIKIVCLVLLNQLVFQGKYGFKMRHLKLLEKFTSVAHIGIPKNILPILLSLMKKLLLFCLTLKN